MDAEDPLLAERKALPAWGVAPQRWKRFPAHAYQNSAQSGIHGIDHPARDQIEAKSFEYSSTKLGRTIIVPLRGMCRWAKRYSRDVSADVHLPKVPWNA